MLLILKKMNPILEVKKLTKSFGDFQALRNINFHVNRGEIYGFLGPNGAGKSTSLRIILGLVYANSGAVFFNNNNILDSNNRSYLASIGALIERPDFYDDLSAIRNLELCGKLNGISDKNKINELIDLVGLNGRGRDKFKTYSQGMKQRLGIAQSLLHDPELIILDEPSTGLDPQGQLDMLNLIKQINKELGKTIVFSTHILREIESVADRMVIINKGETIKEGRVVDLLKENDSSVLIRVENVEKLRNLLSYKNIKFTEMNEEFNVELSTMKIEYFSSLVIDEGCGLQKIVNNSTLEDMFLKTLKDA
jgi:ABC-2 type transport system ATP-binding protein